MGGQGGINCYLEIVESESILSCVMIRLKKLLEFACSIFAIHLIFAVFVAFFLVVICDKFTRKSVVSVD